MREQATAYFGGRASSGRRVLLVRGDAVACNALAGELALYTDDSIDVAATGAEALALVERVRFDIILLEALLPDVDGRELCRVLRDRGFRGPIILLSASRAEADAISGLDAGANDFVVMPYHLGLLLARMRAHLRQFERSEDAVLEIGPYSFDCGRRRLTENATGRKIGLSAKEAALLKYLYFNRDTTAGMAAIMRDVWGYRSGVATHTAETHIWRLRQKIEPDPARPRMILRVAGGYRLNVGNQSGDGSGFAAANGGSERLKRLGESDRLGGERNLPS